MVDEKRNLYQRIQAVALEVTKVDKTGKTQFGSKATSIGDVENALRGPMFEHGVITHWSLNQLTDLSNGKLWMATMMVSVVNADNSDDFFMDQWSEIGSNPMAATSFARKGWLKATFHLTGDEDEAHTPMPETTRRQPARNVNRETGEIPFGPDPKPSTKTQSIAPHIPQGRVNEPPDSDDLSVLGIATATPFDLESYRTEVRAEVVKIAQNENREATDIFNLAAKEEGVVNPKGFPAFSHAELIKIRNWCVKRSDKVLA